MARGRPITPPQKHQLAVDVAAGYSVAEASKRNGIGYETARQILKGKDARSGQDFRVARLEADLPGPRDVDDLPPEAKDALDDIVLFARRYYGLILMPWQVESAGVVTKLLGTDNDEWLVVNAPPGSGKSAFFTRVLPSWLTVKDRTIRGLIGSISHSLASWYTLQLRREFERVLPAKAEAEALRLGIGLDAEATLAGDYGLFKPTVPDIWRKDSFVVAQVGDVAPVDKEPTWSAFGRDSTFLGGRFRFVIWDDLYDPDKFRSAEIRDDLKRWFSQYAEARLEPGGLFVLQGQRFDADDIYRFALDMTMGEDEDDESADRAPKYHHIKFKAHYDDRCAGDHKRNAKPYPQGCLLYPRRLSWKRLSTIKENAEEWFEVVYQQEDVDPAEVLVQKLWVSGGKGVDGIDYPGCWDTDRDLCELPEGISRPLVSIATVDPSPTMFWAIQWWVYHPASEQRFLMDLVRKKMNANQFLYYDPVTQQFSGLAEDWQVRSAEMGVPIEVWIVEQNVSQRYITQHGYYDHWRRLRSTEVLGHETTWKKKSDEHYGIQNLAPHWKHGRVRLPGKQFTGDIRSMARPTSMKLVEEVTTYPKGRYDDNVMAEWFFEFNLPNLWNPQAGKSSRTWVPSWMSRRAS